MYRHFVARLLSRAEGEEEKESAWFTKNLFKLMICCEYEKNQGFASHPYLSTEEKKSADPSVFLNT